MESTPAQTPRSSESGFALIEILVSALIIVIAGGAVLTLLQSTARSAGDGRRHSDAYALAQEDQANLRTLRLASLNHLERTRTVTLGGNRFSVKSTGVFVNNATGTTSCTTEGASADYVKITSTVSWPGIGSRPPATIQSIVSPASGSLDPGHGTLTISATNAAGTPLTGVSISGAGPGAFSGSTDAGGCANFADLPSGNYTMITSAAGMVNENGETSSSKTVGVIASGPQTVSLRYDSPGSIPVNFKYRVGSSSNFETAYADSIYVYNAEMSSGGQQAGEPGGSRLSAITATSLFPFTSPDTVYAGSCEGDNPNPTNQTNPPGAAAMAAVVVAAGQPTSPVTLQLPALNLTVKNGSNPLSGAKVTITETKCKIGNSYVKRTYTTNSNGNQSLTTGSVAEPGLPWGVYDICASANISGTNRRVREFEVPIQNLTSGTTKSYNLAGGESNKTC